MKLTVFYQSSKRSVLQMFTIVLHQNSKSRKPDQNAIKSQQRPNLLFTSSDHLPSPVDAPQKVSMLNKINAVEYRPSIVFLRKDLIMQFTNRFLRLGLGSMAVIQNVSKSIIMFPS